MPDKEIEINNKLSVHKTGQKIAQICPYSLEYYVL